MLGTEIPLIFGSFLIMHANGSIPRSNSRQDSGSPWRIPLVILYASLRKPFIATFVSASLYSALTVFMKKVGKHTLIHEDQAGFIPRRSIFNHIRLARSIISYAEVMEEDGAIIALDQEKAYDKIRHDYLWRTLESFNIPQTFIKTIQALYRNAQTQIAINGVFSPPFNVTRGVRQGDPLSCPLFDLAIEPLACMLRGDNRISGIATPNTDRNILVTMFADDITLYLNKHDRFDDVQGVLNRWCSVSGAKFNIEKTEIIPIGTEEHRSTVVATRKINHRDLSPLVFKGLVFFGLLTLFG
jgi:hypothetical protein